MNEHAMKAAREIKHGALNGDRRDYEFTLDIADEIITRTALEPAVKELREALRKVAATIQDLDLDSDYYIDGRRCKYMKEQLIKDSCAIEAVLAKYPAGGSDV